MAGLIRVGRLRLALSLLTLSLCAGCPYLPDDGGSSSPDTSDNGTFATATTLDLGAAEDAVFRASFSSSRDLDVFRIADLSPGDRLVVDIRALSAGIDPVAALFDAQENIYAFNDDRESDASNLNPRLDVLIRGPRGDYFLGVTPYPGRSDIGEYQIAVTIFRNVGLTTPPTQHIYLNWKGGNRILVPNVNTYDLPAFDAAVVGFDGRTETLKDRIQAVVADRYKAFNLVVLNSDDHATPSVPYTTIHFGGSSPTAFAISEQIDALNGDQGDDAIVYVSSFRNAFSRTPTLDEMATAIGNTVAHEIGHLLGLIHTRDCAELMDTTCGNNSLLIEQAFGRAALDNSVFPIGFQDAVALLTYTLGLAM